MSQVEQCLCRAFAEIEGGHLVSSNRGRCKGPSQLGDILFETSVKQVHAPGGNKTFETSRKRLMSSRGMFRYDSITVSSAWELTSVSMRYSQGE